MMETVSPVSDRISRGAVFSPDARVLYVPFGNTVRIYSITTGALLATCIGHQGVVSGIVPHPTRAKQIITSSLDGTLIIWDADDGTCLKKIRVASAPVVRLATTPAGVLPSTGAAARVYAVVSITRNSVTATSAASKQRQRQSASSSSDGRKSTGGVDKNTGVAKKGAIIAASDTKDSTNGQKQQQQQQQQRKNNSKQPPPPEQHDDDDDDNNVEDIASAEIDIALQQGGSKSYPLGDEAACLQVRPPSYAISATLDARGIRRVTTTARIVEVDVHADTVRALFQRKGFVTGLDVRVCESTSSVPSRSSSSSGNNNSSTGVSAASTGVAVAVSLRHSLYIFRRISCSVSSSSFLGASSNSTNEGCSLTVYRSLRLLSCVALHPSEPYVSVGELNGQIATYFLPELTPSQNSNSTTTALATTTTSLSSSSSSSSIPFFNEATPGSSNARRTEVHWHAHAAWASTYVPDGTFLLTGGEEATLVLWQVPPPSAGGAGGPSKDKRTMNFVPRLGAPIRAISSYSAAAPGVPSAVALAAAGGAGDGALVTTTTTAAEGSHVREAPPLMFAVTLVDNSVVLLNGLTLRSMWKVHGLGIAGQPARIPVGVVMFAQKAVQKGREKALRIALENGDAQAAIRARAASSALFNPPPLPSMLYAYSRHMRKGCVVDPRTRGGIYMNGFPGKASLQLYDVHHGVVGMEVDIGTRNQVSRTDEEPAPPVRVTHTALSYDGTSLVTVEVVAGAEAGVETSILKFWQWNTVENRFQLTSRVDSPHKAEITVLEYHPTEHLVVTASRDRTFKQWQRDTRALAHASEAGSKLPSADSSSSNQTNQKATKNGSKNGEKSSSSAAPVSTPAAVPEISYVFTWTCLSVGFYRDYPVTAGAFSGDGSLLALAYSHMLTLWSPRANALKRTLVHPLLGNSPFGGAEGINSNTSGSSGSGNSGDSSSSSPFSSSAADIHSHDDAEAEDHGDGSDGEANTGTGSSINNINSTSGGSVINSTGVGAKRGRATSNGASSTAIAVARSGAGGGGGEGGIPPIRSSQPPITHVAFAGHSQYLICGTKRGFCVWDLLTCTVAWSYTTARVCTLTADRIGLSVSDRFAVVVRTALSSSGGSDDDDNSSSNKEGDESGNNKQQHVCLLFEAASPVPLSVWKLQDTMTCSAAATTLSSAAVNVGGGGGGSNTTMTAVKPPTSALPGSMLASSLYSLTFVPQAALPTSAAAPASSTTTSSVTTPTPAPGTSSVAHGIVVFGPLNEVYALRAPPHVATVPATSMSAKAAASLATSSVRAPVDIVASSTSTNTTATTAPTTTTTSSSNSKHNSVVSARVVTSGFGGLNIPSTAPSHQSNNSSRSSASSSISAVMSSHGLSAAVASFGPAAVVQTPAHVFEGLLSTFLAPASSTISSSSGTSSASPHLRAKKPNSGDMDSAFSTSTGNQDASWSLDLESMLGYGGGEGGGGSFKPSVAAVSRAPAASVALPTLSSGLMGLFGASNKAQSAPTIAPASAKKAGKQ